MRRHGLCDWQLYKMRDLLWAVKLNESTKAKRTYIAQRGRVVLQDFRLTKWRIIKLRCSDSQVTHQGRYASFCVG